MSEFPRTLRGLQRDGFGRTVVTLVIVTILLAGWVAWFFLARITVYEVSTLARLQVDRAVHHVQSQVSGRVVANRFALGAEVAAGEVLIVLDSASQELELEEARRRREALEPQLDSLRDEATTEEEALEQEREAAEAGVEEARARAREVEIAARLAEEEAERASKLHADGLLAEAELLRARAEAEGRRATAQSLQRALERLEPEQGARQRDRQARIEQLHRETARLEGEVAAASAAIERLQGQIEQRSIRAPATGRVAEAAEIEAGAFVSPGDQLGVVLAEGVIKAVADYSPAAALGRIRPGQPVRMRLDGFPSAQYGSLVASVAGVSGELRDGLVRVELDVAPDSNSALPLEHGLPGSTEVEIERVSPATLALRAAGKLLTGSPSEGG